MTAPSFSRIEILHGTSTDLRETAKALKALAVELEQIADITDGGLMTLAAHSKIRETSQKLRGTA